MSAPIDENAIKEIGSARDQVVLELRKSIVGMEDVIAAIDHVCQLLGNANHIALGSDFDGGFGLQSIPPELDSIADLQIIATKLMERGYSESDAANILGGNWLRFLRKNLPV